MSRRFVVALITLMLIIASAGLAAAFDVHTSNVSSDYVFAASDRLQGASGVSVIGADVYAPQLREMTGADGSSIVIAVVDTGIEPAHRDLQITTDGFSKIIDWIDVSGEGEVVLTQRVGIGDGRVRTELGLADMSTIESKSGYVWVGVLRERELDPMGRIQQDLNRDGRTDGEYLVVASDPQRAGQYDTVFVDTLQTNRFSAHQSMKEFRYSGDYRWFGDRDDGSTATAFCVARILDGGQRVILGFDGNGHGTHVAGIVAANGGSSGLMGVAPGAQLIAVKALPSSGRGSWSQIETGIRAAAESGADVIVVSITALQGGSDRPQQLFSELSAEYGALFVAAAGNSGPALQSVAFSSDPASTIVVGACMTSSLWKDLYGYDVPSDTLWYYSSVGPCHDAGMSPDVIAPGSALSTVPSWEGTDSYDLMEGTSMAVPHVAGVVSLLIDAATSRGIDVTPGLLHASITRGAASIDGYTMAEQGHGLVNAVASWDWLSTEGYLLPPLYNNIRWEVARPHGDGGAVDGVIYREFIPDSILLTALSRYQNARMLLYDRTWLKSDRSSVNMAAGARRTFSVQLDTDSAGLYSDAVRGVTGGQHDRLLNVTAIISHSLNLSDGRYLQLPGSLSPGRYQREYFDITDQCTEFELELTVLQGEEQAQGRVRMHVFAPDGTEMYMGQFIGAPDDAAIRDYVRFAFPMSGVWEVIVYSAASLSAFDLKRSDYRLSARAHYLKVSQPAGGVMTVTAGGLMGSNLLTITRVGRSDSFKPQFITIPGQEVVTVTKRPVLIRDESVTTVLPEVKPGASLLRVTVANPSDQQTDLDLYVYHRSSATGTWREAGRSATGQVSTERVEIKAPEPGQYVAYVDARRQASGSVEFDLRAEVVPEVYVFDGVESKLLSGGQSYTVSVQRSWFRSDVADTVYVGVADRQGSIVSLLPLRLDTRRTELIVQVQPPALSAGQDSVTVTVHEHDTGKPVDVPVLINGRLFYAHNGQIRLPVVNSRYRFDIEIDHGEYRYVKRSFIVDEVVVAPEPGVDYLRSMLEDKIRRRM